MKKLGFYILLVFFVTVQFSCKKELNALPANAIVSGDVIQDETTAGESGVGVGSRASWTTRGEPLAATQLAVEVHGARMDRVQGLNPVGHLRE